MGSMPRKKESRLEVRVASRDKKLIERAAFLRGQSVSAYSVSTLIEDARQVIDSADRILLTDRDRDAFLKILDKGPNQELLEAAREYQDWEDRK